MAWTDGCVRAVSTGLSAHRCAPPLRKRLADPDALCFKNGGKFGAIGSRKLSNLAPRLSLVQKRTFLRRRS